MMYATATSTQTRDLAGSLRRHDALTRVMRSNIAKDIRAARIAHRQSPDIYGRLVSQDLDFITVAHSLGMAVNPFALAVRRLLTTRGAGE